MPTKDISKVLVPDAVLNLYKPALTSAWGIAVAGWALAICLYIAGSIVIGLSYSLKYTINAAFASTDAIFIGGVVTVVAVTAVVRLGGPSANGLSHTLIGSALVLFALLGAVAIVFGVLGIFVAFDDHGFSGIFEALVSHVAGIVLGLVAIIWSYGEIAALSKSAKAQGEPGSKGLDKLVPSAILGRPELASSWELVLVGWMVAIWLYSIAALPAAPTSDLGAALSVLIAGGPAGIVAITIVARVRAAQRSDLAHLSLDAALVLTIPLGLVLIVFSIIAFFKAFSYSPFGVVIGSWGLCAAGLVLGVITVAWAFGEIAVLRNFTPGQTFAAPGGVQGSSPIAPSPIPPPPPPPPTVAPPTTDS